MNRGQTPAISAPTTGTTATAMRHKGRQPIKAATCSATQAEQAAPSRRVPERKVEQEPKWNGASPCCKDISVACSGVPVVHANTGQFFAKGTNNEL
jgi:hypothetical protein